MACGKPQTRQSQLLIVSDHEIIPVYLSNCWCYWSSPEGSALVFDTWLWHLQSPEVIHKNTARFLFATASQPAHQQLYRICNTAKSTTSVISV